MIDLHTHTYLSDGKLGPAALARAARIAGYRAIALTDHVDTSTMDLIVPRLIALAQEYSAFMDMTIIPGVELTHVPAALLGLEVERARKMGAALVLVHGETVFEPVEKGTNLAAIEAGVDILAHPGLITDEESRRAAQQGVYLEISTRPSHGLTNGHVLHQARKHGVKIVINNDAHGPKDLLERERHYKVSLGCGMTADEYHKAQKHSWDLVSHFLSL